MLFTPENQALKSDVIAPNKLPNVMNKLFSPQFLRIAVLFFATVFSIIVESRAASATAAPGKKVTLSVAANGTSPFTYQWKKNGVNISGATASTYVMVGVQTADSGNYTVAVSNGAGSTISDIGTLLVISGSGDFNGDGNMDLLWH